jgi:TraM recognition site of TraD and TraG/Helicase HerA, central domain
MLDPMNGAELNGSWIARESSSAPTRLRQTIPTIRRSTTTYAYLVALMRRPHSRHTADEPWLVRFLKNPRLPSLHGFFAHLIHIVELAAIVAGAAGALWLVGRGFAIWNRRRLATSGVRYEIALPEEVDRQGLVHFFLSLGTLLRPRMFGRTPWIGFAFVAHEQRLRLDLFCSGDVPSASVKAALEEVLGGASIECAATCKPVMARGAASSTCSLFAADAPCLPFETDHRSDPSRMVLAALAGQRANEGAIVQLLLRPASSKARKRALARARKLRHGAPRSLWPAPLRFGAELVEDVLNIFLPGSGSSRSAQANQASAPDPWSIERAKLVEEKAMQPLLAASLRLVAFALDRRRARERLAVLVASLAPFHGHARLRRGYEPFFWPRLRAWLPPLRPRLLLTPVEAASILPLPERPAEAPLSLAEPPARPLAPAVEAPRHGMLLGRPDREGYGTELRVAPEALLQHAHVLGPTGRGKSTLLLNLALEWIEAGLGLALLDPKGDLVHALLQRIPSSRVDDVVLLDLGDQSYPPAFNLLASRTEEADLQVEALTGIFRRLFTRFWGPRSEDILRAALATLLTGGREGESAATLAQVLELLTDPSERGRYVVRDPVALAQFWRQWNEFSIGQREQALAPLSNKLRAFLSQRQLRNVLCQSAAPDFEGIVSEGKILLCSLPKGVLGVDAATLIGSVVTYRLWQATQRLGPGWERPPFLCLVDEFHQFCHLPQGLAEALAEARGYGLGFVLAHQHLGQLTDRELAEAVEANCQTKICFALSPHDAARMGRHFEPRLSAYDLEHLGAFRIACRIAHEGRQLPAATCETLPLPSRTESDSEFVIRRRTQATAKTREEVEAQLVKRFAREAEPPPGRAEADQPFPGSPTGLPPDGDVEAGETRDGLVDRGD